MIGVIKSGYNLKLQNFEGPLDLLTELIGDAKLDITEISLSNITDQYLQYIRTMQLFNIDIASEFFVVAASLVFIKTKKLLPRMKEDEEEILDEQELLERLKEYKIYRHLARELEKIKTNGSIYFRRGYVRYPMGGKSTVKEIDNLLIGDLISVLSRYKGSFIKKAIPIKRREVSVEQKMTFITGLLKHKKMLKFSELVQGDSNKIDKIATFLGATELSFRQKVLLRQLKLFADIDIERRETELYA